MRGANYRSSDRRLFTVLKSSGGRLCDGKSLPRRDFCICGCLRWETFLGGGRSYKWDTGSRRELVANCVHTGDADATKQFRRIGVGGVYWALQ